MQNIFYTIKSQLPDQPLSGVTLSEAWRFLYALPLSDLETFAATLEDGTVDVLQSFEDNHPLWTAVSFTIPEWPVEGELDFEANKYRLGRALYDICAQTEQKEAGDWRQWLSNVSQGTLRFMGNTESVEYYERMYTLLAWLYLPSITNREFDFLIGNYFVVKALRIGLDVKTLLKEYLDEGYIIPRVRHDIIAHWLELLDDNRITLATSEGAPSHTVAEWLALARAEIGRQPTDSDIEKFMAAHPESAALLESDKEVLRELILLYATLKSGAWDNHPHVIREFSEDIFDLLDKDTADNPAILAAIEAPFRAWFAKQPDLRGRQKIILSLIDRIEIAGHIECLTTINDWCNDLDPAHPGMDLFYYDEAEQKFLWNEELFIKDPTVYELQPTIMREPPTV